MNIKYVIEYVIPKYSRARWIASGIGGGVGKWAPCGWKPFSSAIYVTSINCPSGAVYE